MPQEQEPRSDMHRARRGRNLALMLVLLALVAVFYVVTLVRMGD